MSEIDALKQELKDFQNEVWAELRKLNKQASCRVGPEGPRGIQGNPGKDAIVLIVQASGKAQILDETGACKAEIIPVRGTDGVSPNADEITDKVIKAVQDWIRTRMVLTIGGVK